MSLAGHAQDDVTDVQARPLGVFEWVLMFIGPLFIAAALWRLARTS